MAEPAPLLLLHPAATLGAVWAPLRPAWGGQRRVIVPDLFPDGDPPAQLGRWADLAAAQLAGGAPAHVVGASLGASVALRLALDHPQLIASLTLDSAQLGGPPPPRALRALGRLAGALASRLPAGLLAAALLSQFPAYAAADRAAVRADMLRLGAAGVVGHLRAQLAHDVRAEAGRIAAPTLLIAGGRDPLTRAGAHLALRAAIPGARLALAPGAGHVTFLSRPEVILHEVAAWIARWDV